MIDRASSNTCPLHGGRCSLFRLMTVDNEANRLPSVSVRLGEVVLGDVASLVRFVKETAAMGSLKVLSPISDMVE